MKHYLPLVALLSALGLTACHDDEVATTSE